MDQNKRGNILVVDDNIPDDITGQGFNRAKTILETISTSFDVTLFPSNYTEADSHKLKYFESMGITTNLVSRGGHGMNIYNVISDHIKKYNDKYNIIYISRPHNFRYIYDACGKYSPRAKIIYDAEALFYKRACLQFYTTGKISLWPPCDTPSWEVCEQEKQKELEMLSRADNVIVVSDNERDIVTRHIPSLHGKVVVYGHPMLPDPTPASWEQRNDIFFLGSFVNDETPNTDAIVYFVQNILPLVRKQLDCRLVIGGNQPTEKVLKLANDHVIVKGYIENTREYYNNCKLFIAPHRYAGGIPWKLSEALSQGIPSIISPLLANQMNLSDDTVGIGSTPETFAYKLIEAYTNVQVWNNYRRNSVQYITETHNPVMFRERLYKKLREMIAVTK